MDNPEAAAGAQAGRRAGQGQSRRDNAGENAQKAAPGWGAEPASPEGAGAVKAGRRAGMNPSAGWGAETEVAEASSPPKPPSPPARRASPDSDDDNVMQMIPDLEEEEVESIARQVAEAAPTHHQMESIDMLDHETAGGLHSMVDRGIDLTLLTTCLSAGKHVEEEDRPWDFNGMLAEVQAELQVDIDKQEAAKEEAVVEAAVAAAK